MARLVIGADAVSSETFLPGQLFVFGGFALHANSTGHLEQIDSYAPGHQIRFGSFNYIADVQGDLVFEGFLASAAAPHEGSTSNPPSDSVQGSTLVPALALDPKRTTRSEDGRINPAGLSAITELPAGDLEVTMPSVGPESSGTLPVIGKPDSSPVLNSKLSRSASTKLGQVVITGPSPAGPQSPI